MPLAPDVARTLDRRIGLWGQSALTKLSGRPVVMLRSKLIERRCRASGKIAPVTATTFWGEPMHVVFPDRVSMAIYRYGLFEPELTRAFVHYLKPGQTFFDVGSHFGFFSLLAAHLVGPSGRVVAFEPTPSTFEMVSKNLAGRPNARVVNVAAFREDTTLSFHDWGLELSGFNSIYGGKMTEDERRRANIKPITVQARALDSWVAETGIAPDFLKIDTEGAEPDVLAGMDRILREKRPILTLEVGDTPGAPPEIKSSRSVVDTVLSKGYRAFEFIGSSPVPHTPRDRYEYTNIIFVPQERAGPR